MIMDTPANSAISRDKVKEAATALIAFHKSKQNADEIMFGEALKIQLQVSVWKITTKKSKTHQIKLPHCPHPGSPGVCLFVKDEPNVDSEQCQLNYKDKLRMAGITCVDEVIPLKMLRKEYIPFEARRRLSRSYNLFLADSRIFGMLHPHLGKEFYKRNRYPVTVNLEKKDLKTELETAVNATYLILTHRGSCSTVTIGNTAMPAEAVTDNTMATIASLQRFIPEGQRNIKSIFVRTEKSVSLPVYTSLIHEEWEPVAKGDQDRTVVDNSDITRLNRQMRLEAKRAKAKAKTETQVKADQKDVQAVSEKKKSLKRKKQKASEAATPGKVAKKSGQGSVGGAGLRKPTPKVGGKKKKK
ncbi:ribosomal L1 domain-containing protein 1-like [Diadema antillarum]|uniref:ribosomal L1 domain-containing protein 1-like n=1 Tax=Diadema antillarum TaxID=105358 RepID=UPI003A88C908